MEYVGYRANYSVTDENTQMILVVTSRAIQLLQSGYQVGEIDLEGSKLLFELRCSYALIMAIGPETYIESIGLEQFCDHLAAIHGLEWSGDERILQNFLGWKVACYYSEYDEKRDMERYSTKH